MTAYKFTLRCVLVMTEAAIIIFVPTQDCFIRLTVYDKAKLQSLHCSSLGSSVELLVSYDKD